MTSASNGLGWVKERRGIDLLDLLYAEIGRRERSQTFDSFPPGIQLQGRKDRVFSSPQSCGIKPKAHATPSVAAFVASENPYKRCAFCAGEHYSDQCSKIKDLDLDKRKEKVKKWVYVSFV